MNRHSLSRRVAVAFAKCVAVLSVIWGFAFFSAIRLSEDRVLAQQLMVAAASYPDLTLNIRGYDDVVDLPETLKGWAQTKPEQGLYEFTEEELHVAVVPGNDKQRRAFVVFDVAGIEAASLEDWWLLIGITCVVTALGALGFGLGLIVMRKAVAPVTLLARVVSDIDLEHLSAADYRRIKAGRFGDDEVGMLAATIEKTLERISAFVERERYFTGAASHELRTPVTVITGALELLETANLAATDVRTIDRIRRATLDMTTTIETFLCLAREDDEALYVARFPVTPLVWKAIEQQRHLLRGKPVEVTVNDISQPSLSGHEQAFFIAVNNLVRNAFEHNVDGQGSITILVDQRRVCITNQASSHSSEQRTLTGASTSPGYGLGLGIVQRLCERNGWSFALQPDKTRVTACLSW